MPDTRAGDRLIQVDPDILLRRPVENDAEGMFRVLDDSREHLGRWLSWEPLTQTVEDQRENIEQSHTSDQSIRNILGGVIEWRGKIVGMASLGGLSSTDKSAALGYFLGEPYTGNGIASRSCVALINIGFSDYDLHRITIHTASQNLKSRAIAERLGFTFEGTLREASLVRGVFHDLAVYSILSQEWNRTA